MKKSFSERTIILTASLLVQLGAVCFQSHGAAGDVDLTFDPGSGVNGFVWVVVVQPDGKVLLGGTFTMVKGLSRTNLARLNADGSGDATFSPGVAFEAVDSLALQSDGKLLVGGTLAHFECDDFGCYPTTVARLHPDGSRDDTFTPAALPNGNVFCLASQPDGKVLIGGDFTTINGTNRGGLARLNANGGLDSTFNPGSGVLGYPGGVRTIALQPDGKVLIGGGFTAVNGTNRGGIARLNATGSLDSTFNPGTGFSAPHGVYAFSIALQPDGKALIGGNFTSVNGTSRNGIARLNANGSLDSSFDPGAGARDNSSSYYGVGVKSVVLQADGKVLIGGDFTTVNGTNRGGIARLNPNGSLDLGFNPGTSVLGGYGTSVALQADGKVIIAANRIARLSADGSVDGSFDPGSVAHYSASLALQPDGKVLLGGVFNQTAFVNGTNRYGHARLHANGSADSAFVPRSFDPDIGYLGFPYDYRALTAFAVQPDGKVLVAVYYYEQFDCDESGCRYNYRFSITRHHADGTRDLNFEPTVQNTYPPDLEVVSALGTQSDGKIVVGGRFGSIKGVTRSGLARLTAGGSLDTNFVGQLPLYYTASAVVVQPNDKLLIVSTAGGGIGQLARLNANGSFDAGFNPGPIIGNNTGSYPNISSVAVQSDGKVLIGGSFTNVSSTTRNRIARLNADGSLDSSFNPGTGANGAVRSIALQADGNVLIGGDFTTFDGVLRPYIARLFGDTAPSLNIARSNAFMIVSWPVSATDFELQQCTNLSTPQWTTPSETIADNGTTKFISVSPSPGNRYFRLFKP